MTIRWQVISPIDETTLHIYDTWEEAIENCIRVNRIIWSHNFICFKLRVKAYRR